MKNETNKEFLIDDLTNRIQEFITYFKNFPSNLRDIEEDEVLEELIKDLEKIKKDTQNYLVILKGLKN